MRMGGNANPQKNSFDLSNYWTGSGQIGKLIPIRWDDVTPDSHWRIKTNMIIKLAPILAPILHRLDAYVHTFWVPYRLCMPKVGNTNTDWENFIQGDQNTMFTNDIMPYVPMDEAHKGYYLPSSLANYLGLPHIKATDTIHPNADININALPFIAYSLIWDEYYRNPWTQPRNCGPDSNWYIDLSGGDMSSDMTVLMAIRNRSYERDYFTGAYPEAYAGASTDVELDLKWAGGENGTAARAYLAGTGSQAAAGAISVSATGKLNDATPNDIYIAEGTDDAVSTLEILELRRAEALTRFLEAENRTGNERYDEWLKVMFGVQNPDFRDQYPRYICGGKQAINISEVINQSAVYDSTDTLIDPQGFQTGHAVGAGSTGTKSFHATEHGILMTILSIVPRTAYAGGVEKFWLKSDRTEFYNPHFQNIGDQAIYDIELGWDGTITGAGEDEIWAYAPRFAEYKHKLNIICGEFQESDLEYWHMGRMHDHQDGAPTSFNGSFHQIVHTEDHNIRIFASQGTEDHLYIQVYNDIQAILPMHVTDIPK